MLNSSKLEPHCDGPFTAKRPSTRGCALQALVLGRTAETRGVHRDNLEPRRTFALGKTWGASTRLSAATVQRLKQTLHAVDMATLDGAPHVLADGAGPQANRVSSVQFLQGAR